MKKFFTFLLILIGLSIALTACKDDEIALMSMDGGRGTEPEGKTVEAIGMTQGTDGLWRTSRRIPLVGAGRMINTLTGSLVSVIGESGNSSYENITNLDLEDAATINSELIGAQAVMNTLTSVRDIYHTYAAGQSAGFVIKSSNTGLLNLDVLNGFWIALYKDGERVQLKGAESGSSGSLLGLNLLSPSNEDGMMAIAVTAEVPFDEVRIGVYGVKANVLSTLQIMYAYVGDNPAIPVVNGGDSRFTNVSVYEKGTWTYNFWKPENLIDSDLTNVTTKTPSILIDPGAALTVCSGNTEEFKPGMEVGYMMSGFDPLKVSLGSTKLIVYASDRDKKLAELKSGGLVGISALGSNSSVSVVIPQDAGKNGQYAYLHFPGGISLLDVVQVHYAYIREAVSVDITSLFSVGDDETNNDFYQFPLPELSAGKVNYEFVSGPAGAAPSFSAETAGRLNGMTVEGDYKVKMTFTATDNSIYTQTVTIHRNKVWSAEDGCDQLFHIGDEYGTSFGNQSDGGCLLCVGPSWTGGNPDNLIDQDKSSYVSVINPITLIGSEPLATIKFSEKDFQTTNKTRIGFALQVSNELLNVDVLNLFTIACKDVAGNTIAEAHGVAEGNDGISVGLIGGSSGKVRFAIEVDPGKSIHSIELRLNKLLTVKLSSLRLYYVFHEPAEGNCSTGASAELGDACLEMVTPASYGASFNYEEMGGHLANIGAGYNDLSFFIDSKKETYASFGSVLDAGAQVVAVKFNEMKPYQTIGILVGSDTHLADVDLLGGFSMAAYNQGVLVEEQGNGGVLGLQLLGYGSDAMLEATPTQPYDEIRITVGGVLVGKGIKLYGLFTRRDDNGNGIPDCSEGEDEEVSLKLSSITQHVCALSNDTEGTIVATITGGEGNETIELDCNPISVGPETVKKTITLSGISAQFTLPVGDWSITGTWKKEDNNEEIVDFGSVRVMVHPAQTTWTGKNESMPTDWLRWDNWSNGIPWTCTDVLIPSNLQSYPELKAKANTENQTELEFWGKCNYCNRIQFEPGAEVINTHYLNYEQAWVNVSLKSGEYNMFSAPLKETYTGDMFVSIFKGADYNSENVYKGCWLDYTESAYPANRFTPKVYQRLWNASVQNAQNNDGGYVAVNPEDNFWTAPFNLVSQEYKAGQGVLVRPDKEGTNTSTSYTFCFPKRHAKYEYYDLATEQSLGRWESISRNSADVGRFIYEDDSRSVSFPYHVTLENKRPTTMFLAGNPFMAHINIQKFLEANPAVKAIKIVAKNGDKYTYKTDLTQIAPIQAFLVEVKEAYQSTYRYKLNIHFTEDMLEQGNKNE